MMLRRTFLAAGVSLLAICNAPAQANLLVNGSLENVGSTHVNDVDGYMFLAPGAGTIAGWTVKASQTGSLLWGSSPTLDGYNASHLSFFVDLSGAGSTAPNGTLQQTLAGLLVGGTYSVSLDTAGSDAGVLVGGVDVALAVGSSTTFGSTVWTTLTGSFVATAASMLFEVENRTPSSEIVFVDNLRVDAPQSNPMPAPAGAGLILLGIAATAALRRP